MSTLRRCRFEPLLPSASVWLHHPVKLLEPFMCLRFGLHHVNSSLARGVISERNEVAISAKRRSLQRTVYDCVDELQ